MIKKKSKFKSETECDVCGTAHDEEIHEATLRVRQWFGKQVTHRYDDETVIGAE
jgi:hypothetical protein